jgi:hypothetical protein
MPRGRPELYPVKKVIGFDQSMLDAIDHWRRRQTPIPTVSDAIRALVELGLDARSGAAPAEPAHLLKATPSTKTPRARKTRQRSS